MAATDHQGHAAFNFVQVSTAFETNMTGAGFQVIIYITMFWDVTSSRDECFERHTLQFMYPAMEAVLPVA
jgi:hypothetical protein